MLKLGKNIDDVFREGLGNIKVEPSASAWSGIEAQLDNRSRKRNLFIVWGAVAAASVVFAVLGTLIYLQPVVESEQSTYTASMHKNDKQQERIIETKSAVEKPSDITIEPGKAILNDIKKEQPDNMAKTVVGYEEKKQGSENVMTLLQGKGMERLAEADVSAGKLIDNRKKEYLPLFAFNDQQQETKMRMLIGGAVSSSYSFRETASAPTRVYSPYSYSENGINTVGAGINIRIEGKSRWSMETGVIYCQVGQEISSEVNHQAEIYGDAYIKNSVGLVRDYSNSMGRIRFKSAKSSDSHSGIQNEAFGLAYSSPVLNDDQGIKQALNYIEVPLLARYKLIDGFTVVSVAGGVSPNFLVGNSAYMIDGDDRVKIGETEDIKALSWSSSLGIGIELPVNKFIRINVEPRVKYYLESVSSNAAYDFQPYSFSVSGGLTFIIK